MAATDFSLAERLLVFPVRIAVTSRQTARSGGSTLVQPAGSVEDVDEVAEGAVLVDAGRGAEVVGTASRATGELEDSEGFVAR